MNSIKSCFDTILSCSCFNRKKDDDEHSHPQKDKDLKEKRSQDEQIQMKQKSLNAAVNEAFEIEKQLVRVIFYLKFFLEH